MATRLLDTNIVSYILKGHSLAARYQPHLAGHALAVSFMTVAEMYEGALRAGWGIRRLTQLEAALAVISSFPPTRTCADSGGPCAVQRRTRPIGAADAWIAASALRHGCDLVTHNPADFQGIAGLTVITEAP